MTLNKKTRASLSQLLMLGAFISVLLSALGWVGNDFWLASTQWLLVATVLALFGIYLNSF